LLAFGAAQAVHPLAAHLLLDSPLPLLLIPGFLSAIFITVPLSDSPLQILLPFAAAPAAHCFATHLLLDPPLPLLLSLGSFLSAIFIGVLLHDHGFSLISLLRWLFIVFPLACFSIRCCFFSLFRFLLHDDRFCCCAGHSSFCLLAASRSTTACCSALVFSLLFLLLFDFTTTAFAAELAVHDFADRLLLAVLCHSVCSAFCCWICCCGFAPWFAP
jgi:hypothetical protein